MIIYGSIALVETEFGFTGGFFSVFYQILVMNPWVL